MDFVDLTLEELRRYREPEFAVSERELFGRCEGRWLKASVVVCHHLFGEDAMIVSCGPDGGGGVLILFFRPGDDRWHRPASTLCRGKTVHVVGRIQRLVHGTVTLEDCELTGDP